MKTRASTPASLPHAMASILVVAAACAGEAAPPLVETGDRVTVATATIGPGGGEIRVAVPGSPLDGLVLTVPDDAFTSDVTFSVGYRPIATHRVGVDFDPLGPIIEIDDGGAVPDAPLVLRIPVTLAPGRYAMAFLYDDVAGRLEGLPVAGRDDASVTVLVPHLSMIAVTSILDVLCDDNIDRGLLTFDPIETPFRHGVDDWPFENRTTFFAPSGQCLGHCITALHYFAEKRTGEDAPALFSRYDGLTPGFDLDDEDAIQMCSVTNRSLDGDRSMFRYWKDLQKGKPSLSWCALAFALRLTGQPQLVVAYRKNEAGEESGHALIAYRTERDGDIERVYVSDPNRPWRASDTVEPYLEFDLASMAFREFTSSNPAKTDKKVYNDIRYFGTYALIGKKRLASIWSDFERGAIATGTFPDHAFERLSEDGKKWVPLEDGFLTAAETIRVRTRVDGAGLTGAGLRIYGSDGNPLAGKQYQADGDGSSGSVDIALAPGPNVLGLYVTGRDDVEFLYVAFDWMHVDRGDGPADSCCFYACADGSDNAGQSLHLGTFSCADHAGATCPVKARPVYTGIVKCDDCTQPGCFAKWEAMWK